MYNHHYDHWMNLELTSEVVEVKEDNGAYWHRFKETVFFAEGGGMASDTGTINGFQVLEVKKDGDAVWHLLHEKLEGQVHMLVDLDQRIVKCQEHSAGHLAAAVMIERYPEVKSISFSSSEEGNFEEMSFTHFDDDMAKEVERLCNEYIRQDLAITIAYPTREEALQHVEEDQLEHDEPRAVIIEGLDYGMCGCIHVPSLGQIQAMKIIGYEKTTRGYKIYHVCGEQMLRLYDKQLHVLNESAKTLSVGQLDTLAGIKKMQSELKQERSVSATWKQKASEYLATIMHQEAKDICLFHEFDDMDIKTFQSFCSYFVRTYEHGIFFICKGEERAHVIISHSKSITFPANEYFKELGASFPIRGGGNPGMAQGGGEYSSELAQALKAMCEKQNQLLK